MNADDTKSGSVVACLSIPVYPLPIQLDIYSIQNWAQSNKMCLHEDKTFIVNFHSSRITPIDTKYTLEKHPIGKK